ncbi:porin family protein [Acidiphilium acidophilum]|uniref:Uncharacterized protein n=1 Tax=Acidiphilium acidophilum TaxID=76588 RepID=A0AAW9DNU0_ACIAO|nr:hypothetical protein [Acidiphilium acidophilum]MDX5930093.1 hypothetical protein [Acidiphilium acidophilum]
MRKIHRLVGVSWLALAAAAAAATPGVAFADSGDSGASAATTSGASTSATTASGSSVSGGAPAFPGAAALSDLGGAPPFGTAVRLGDAGTLLAPGLSGESAPGAGIGGSGSAVPTPFIQIQPSIGATEQFVTGGYGGYGGSGNGSGHEFVTSINPSLLINGATRATTFTLAYNPSIQFYSNQSQDNGINQSLDGVIDATLIPQMLTVEARAYATEQATSGGLPPGGSSVYNNNNRTLTQSYSITPSFNDTFETGTLNLLYSAQFTRQSGNTAYLTNQNNPYFETGDVFAQTEAGSFTTVPFFRRFDDTPSFSATEDVGSGVLNGAHQYFIKNTVRYAVVPHVVLSASGGYEDLAYSGIPPTLIRDATWSIGARIRFPDNGILVARYQHLYGFNAPYIRLTYQLTQRTTLSAGYSEALSTQQQGIGLGVASSGVNSVGLPIGGLSGQPVLLSNQSLSVQSSLTRNRQFSAALTTQYTYDTVSLSVQAYQDTLVARAPGLVGFSQKSATVSISESHQFSPYATGTVYFDYGRTDSPALNSSTTSTYGFSAAFTYRLSPTLYANAQYSLTNNAYGGYDIGGYGNTGYGSQGVQNIFTVGFRKTF